MEGSGIMRDIRICDDAEPEKVLNLITDNNLGIEIQSFYSTITMDDEEYNTNLINKYKELLPNVKGGRSLHAPFWDLNLGSKTPMIRETTMKAFNYAYKIAKELGCTEIVVHNGFIINTSFYNGWTKNAVSFWQEFFKDKDDSITMMIENQNEEDSEIIKMVIDTLGDKRLKVCLDIGHANANSNMSVEDWIKTLGNRIGYLHLHNNHGKISGRPSYENDEHLSICDGIIDIPKVFSLLEEYCPDAIWNFESKLNTMEKDINYAKELGYIKSTSK